MVRLNPTIAMHIFFYENRVYITFKLISTEFDFMSYLTTIFYAYRVSIESTILVELRVLFKQTSTHGLPPSGGVKGSVNKSLLLPFIFDLSLIKYINLNYDLPKKRILGTNPRINILNKTLNQWKYEIHIIIAFY